MSSLVIPNTFSAGTKAESAKVNANFAAVATWANSAAVQADGSIAMSGQLTLAGDPVSASHAARKSYVDKRAVYAGASQTGILGATINTSTTQMRQEAGTNVLTTDASGFGVITFPLAFPTSVLTVVVSNGDDAIQATMSLGGCTTSTFTFHLRSVVYGTLMPSTTCRVNWIAIGW